MLSTILLQAAAGMGIAKMGQPSAAGEIRTSMLIMGALVEGVALFAIVVCFLALFQ